MNIFGIEAVNPSSFFTVSRRISLDGGLHGKEKIKSIAVADRGSGQESGKAAEVAKTARIQIRTGKCRSGSAEFAGYSVLLKGCRTRMTVTFLPLQEEE